MHAALDSATLDRVRADLEAIDGVRRAVIDEAPLRVYVIAEPNEAQPSEMLVHSVLARHGIGATEAEVKLCWVGAPEPRRRVRFVSAKMQAPRSGRAVARVELEWAGRIYEAELEGESGPALETRLAAAATLVALEEVLSGRVKFQLVGIKPFRAFDADVVVALLRSDVDGRSLLGAALTADDPHRAASIAVLNATNRILGNYLANEGS